MSLIFQFQLYGNRREVKIYINYKILFQSLAVGGGDTMKFASGFSMWTVMQVFINNKLFTCTQDSASQELFSEAGFICSSGVDLECPVIWNHLELSLCFK